MGTLKTLSETITQTMGELANVQRAQLEAFSNQLSSSAQASGERLDGVRSESAAGAKQLREEVVTTLKSISETMADTMKDLAVAEKSQLEAFSAQIASLTKTSGEKLDGIRTEFATGSKQLREEVIAALKGITEATTKTMGELANAQKAQLEAMSSTIIKLSDSNEKKLEAVRVTVEGKLQSMQIDNAKQLDQMRQTVDEKLQGTLEKRLGESFKQVSERLELVHKGLGEMQTLATALVTSRRYSQTSRREGPGVKCNLRRCWNRCSIPISLQPTSPQRIVASVLSLRSSYRDKAQTRMRPSGFRLMPSFLWKTINV